MADLLSIRWHRFCPPPSFHSTTLPQYGACLKTRVWGGTQPLHVTHSDGGGTVVVQWWYPSLALVLRPNFNSLNIWHLSAFLSVVSSALMQLWELQQHLCAADGHPGAEMVPWVAVAAVVESTLLCPPCAVLQVLARSHWWGFGCFEETECSYSSMCHIASTMPSQTSTEQTMLWVCWGICWGKRTAPTSIKLEKGEWNPAEVILPPLLCKLCDWETGALYKEKYSAWGHGHTHVKEDQDHTLKCSLWSPHKSE